MLRAQPTNLVRLKRREERIMSSLVERFQTLSGVQRVAVIAGAAVAVAATGGALAYAVASAESVVLAVGPVLLATGKAAEMFARGRV
jgi:hypothetical protein